MNLIARVAGTIERYAMFRDGQRAGVAVSGGADSVCLLYVLRELSPRWSLRLTVLHLDHGLRGEESRQDAESVRSLACQLALPFELRQAQLAASTGNLEQAAREARLAFFRELTARGAVDRVALGHTRSDQAETVLFRFLRGAATTGLSGIRPVTAEGIVRPLIEIDRPEIEEFLRGLGVGWREDSTNASTVFARNRIRHQLLPQLEREWNPAIRQTLAHTADWALAEEAYWDREIDRMASRILVEADGAVLFRAADVAALPLAVARRLVRRAMEMAKGDLRGLNFDHVAAVLRVVSTASGHGGSHVCGLRVVRSFDWVRFAPPSVAPAGPYSLAVSMPGYACPPGTNLRISLEVIEKSGTSEASDSVYNERMGCVDGGRLSLPLELRNWHPGDRYRPMGYSVEEKIKTLFHKARIPVWERGAWPVLTAGRAIVWARLFGPAADMAAGPGCISPVRIRERRAKPESELPESASIQVE
jgi:tRNA(Ile)-lysidine synthase